MQPIYMPKLNYHVWAYRDIFYSTFWALQYMVVKYWLSFGVFLIEKLL